LFIINTLSIISANVPVNDKISMHNDEECDKISIIICIGATTMAKLLISACLLGQNVRYNGGNCLLEHPELKQLIANGDVISICPECAGGMPIPRPAANIQGNNGGAGVLSGNAQVKTETGDDVTDAFIQGAQKALALAQMNNIQIALLKARSPSCGNVEIYQAVGNDRQLIAGAGVTATLLIRHGIQVFNENQIAEALIALKTK
jgi:uncharacterized protein YbbK (DUF523 family)